MVNDFEDNDQVFDDNCHEISYQVGLANTVDSALMEFSIDGKGCIAKSM